MLHTPSMHVSGHEVIIVSVGVGTGVVVGGRCDVVRRIENVSVYDADPRERDSDGDALDSDSVGDRVIGTLLVGVGRSVSDDVIDVE